MRARAVICICVLGISLAACGGGDSESGGEPVTLTPELVQANLDSAGYEVGDLVTSGANEAVAQNGQLDAQAYLDVEAAPGGGDLFGAVYFFDTEADAKVLDKEMTRQDDEFNAHEIRGARVYYVSGTQEELDGIVAAAEGG